MKAYFTLTPWQSTPRPFAKCRALGNPLEFGLQAFYLVGLCVLCLALILGDAVVLRPGIDAMNAHPKPLGYLGRWMPTVSHLLDRRDLEFFRVPLSTHVDSFCTEL